MGGLAHYLEEEGLPTTQISLVRLHTEKIKPPRALWVPFEMGRPLGPPNQPEFQTSVLKAALNLLTRDHGPVLEDFDLEAPASEAPANDVVWACPYSPAASTEALDDTGQLIADFLDEVARLRTWYDLALANTGRTTVGVSGLEPEQAAKYLSEFLKGVVPASPKPDLETGWMVKFASEDVKAYYLEAASAQPGGLGAGSRRLNDWFWYETTASRVYVQLSQIMGQSNDGWTRIMGQGMMVPRGHGRGRPAGPDH